MYNFYCECIVIFIIKNGEKENEEEKGYKVVSCFSDNIKKSWTTNGNVIFYKFEKWVDRPDECGPLAVFKYKKDAIDFVLRYSFEFDVDDFIVKCDYIRSTDTILWNDRKYTKKDLPVGTVLADRVKIKRG